MKFENCVIYLVGFPGVGKLSIAKEICKRADFQLVDSHAINRLVFPLVRKSGKSPLPAEIWTVTRRLREIVLETMVELGPPEFNFLLTNVLLDGQEKDLAVYQSVENAVARRNGCLIPVRVICEETENAARIVSPDRELDFKLTDERRVADFHQNSVTFNPVQPNALTVDVTNLSASEASESILEFASSAFQAWKNSGSASLTG